LCSDSYCKRTTVIFGRRFSKLSELTSIESYLKPVTHGYIIFKAS